MSDNALLAVVLCISISSCSACAVSENWKQVELAKRDVNLTPMQMCMQRAFGDANRRECLKMDNAKN